MSSFLMMAGLILFLAGLWDVRRQTRQMTVTAQEAPERLSRLADELVLAAEEATITMKQRSEAMEELLKTADDRLTALRSALARAENVAAPEPPVAAIEPLQGVMDAVPVALAAAKPLRATGRDAEVEQLRQQLERATLIGKSDVHTQVWELADRGMGSAAIARHLGMSKGEVDLILGLRRLDREGEGA